MQRILLAAVLAIALAAPAAAHIPDHCVVHETEYGDAIDVLVGLVGADAPKPEFQEATGELLNVILGALRCIEGEGKGSSLPLHPSRSCNGPLASGHFEDCSLNLSHWRHNSLIFRS